AVVLPQERLVVEQIELRRRAGHEEVDDLLRLRREVRTDTMSDRGRGVLSRRGEQPLVEQRRERDAAQAEAGLAEEVSAGGLAETEALIGHGAGSVSAELKFGPTS